MQALIDLLRAVPYGLAAALLPARDRQRLAWDHALDVPRWSVGLGLLQIAVGTHLFLFRGLAFTRAASDEGSMVLLENWIPGLTNIHFQGLGALNWVAWLVVPLSWPFSYLAVTGAARCVAFGAARESIGEPLVVLIVALWRKARAGQKRRRRLVELGPPRPDRVVASPDGRLIVLTCREKPEWTETVTVEVVEQYYQVSGPQERRDERWTLLAYTLRPEPDGAAVIRKLVRYSPPGQE